MTTAAIGRALVLGGGFAGVLAAMVLARHAAEVVVIERDGYPAVPGRRKGIPQGYHSHVLVAGGARALEALLPGVEGKLLAHGAHRRGLPGEALVYSSLGWFRRHDTGAYLLSCSRWLLDHVVRQQALAGGGVRVWQHTRALGLTGGASRVTGAVVAREGLAAQQIRADLVVDAMGRRSPAGRWLADLGAQRVEEVTVDTGLAYSTRVYRAPGEPAGAIPAVMVHPSPVTGRPSQGATLFPIEDGRWIVTLTGTLGGEPPTDEQGFDDFARSLRSPVVARLMALATPEGGVRPYRDTANRRRFYEKMPLPQGFLALGDAVAAVNPVHSHGLSVAALSALRLDRELERRGLDGLQAAMAAEAERSWRMAVEQRMWMTPATLSSPLLMAQLFRAQTLLPSEVDTSVFAELAREPEPALTTAEAIAQYPGLPDLCVGSE